jgi:hypothetical protein
MKHKQLPSVERLREALSYDPESGVVTWKDNFHKSRIGTQAGHLRSNGYYYIVFDGKTYVLARLIWKLATGEDPGQHQVDHIDRDRTNNKLENLRLVSPSENCRNRSLFPTNKTGVEGVRFKSGKYEAFVTIEGVYTYLGRFTDLTEATTARLSFTGAN